MATPASQVSLSIDDLDDEGRGVGVHEGLSIHVAGALPGDRARVVVEHRSPHEPVAWARLSVLEQESPSRVPPVCLATGRCGGCPLGALDYAAQLAWKQRRLATALATVPGCPTPEPLSAAPSPTAYRNSARLVYGRPRTDAPVCLGGYASRSHRLIDLAGCRVVEPPLDEVRGAVLDVLRDTGVEPFDEQTRAGLLAYVALRVNRRGDVLVTLVGAWTAAPIALGERVAGAHPAIVGVCAAQRPQGNAIFGAEPEVLAGRGELEEQMGSVRLLLSPTAFFQVNRSTTASLYAALADLLVARSAGRTVDAYAGVGGIALTLAAHGIGEVLGVEVNPAAVHDAERAAQLASLASIAGDGSSEASKAHAGQAVRFFAADAAAGLRTASAERPVDTVVVNPPRGGLDAGMRAAIGEASPRLVAYISCDPDTLARDLRELAAQGLSIESVRGFDMHPQTPHVEALALLTRSSDRG